MRSAQRSGEIVGEFKIRRAEVKDLEVLVRQRRAMWEDMDVKKKHALDAHDKVFRRWARKRLKDGTLIGWLAERSDGFTAAGGCLWLQPILPLPGVRKLTQAHLLSMHTLPDYRRKGLASQIAEAAVKWSKENGYGWVTLHASKVGRDLYRGFGFKRTWEMKLDLVGGE